MPQMTEEAPKVETNGTHVENGTASATAPKKRKTKAEKSEKGKPASQGRPKQSGLRKPQIRILKALSKANHLTREQIAKKAPVDLAACVEYLGATDKETREKNDKKHFPSLLTLQMVRTTLPDDPEKSEATTYEITAKGKAALEKAEAK